ncbi:hypothetical protein ACIREE_38395 [Streptomyces sp. NPDC102467]|uniref:hypothetical protein n=1 Tax=Streptomyces sp. NPDC102467 TaxID=3366179 RepID=UPI0037FB1313
MEEVILMGSLFEELEAREAVARVRVDELEEQLAEVTGRLEEAREDLGRLRIARETVSEVMAEMSANASARQTQSRKPSGQTSPRRHLRTQEPSGTW